MSLPIYLINLPSAQARLAHMRAQLDALAMPFEVIEAVNGRTLDTAACESLYSERLNQRRFYRPLTPGEIGCYGSHIAVWQRIAERGETIAMVLEDDVELKDVLIEHGGHGLYRPLDLRIARCRMSVAVRDDFDYAAAVRQGSRLRVATKYTLTARRHFADKGVHVDLIKLYGSMELAPLTGLADAIVDMVSTGATLRANHLIEVERIIDISARLVVNQAALKLKREPLRALIDAIEAALPDPPGPPTR
jgi:hypothetical protein